MDKIYRVLRNNNETGPFSLDELLKQNLRASDMIWIEGSSNAWAQLSEMELRPSFQKLSTPVQPKIQSAVPTTEAEDIEAKAEEIRKKVLAYSLNQSSTPSAPARMYKDPVPPPPLSERNNIDIVSHKKVRKNILTEVVVTVALIGLFATGIFNRNLFKNDATPSNTEAIKILSEDEHAAKPEIKNADPLQPVTPNTIDSTSVAAGSLLEPVVKKNTALKAKATTPVRKIDLSTSETPAPASDNTTTASAPKKDEAAQQVEIKKEIVASNNGDEEVKEKKKTLGQAIKGIFKKKKKD